MDGNRAGRLAHKRAEKPTGKVFMTGRSQAVRIPKAFRFDCDEVDVQRSGDSLLLTPKRKVRKYKSWADYFKNAPRLSADFPDDIPDFPPESMRDVKL